MKYISGFWVKIAVAIMLGFLFACAATDTTYTCAPIDGAAGCASFQKSVMHPSDLLNNKQDSLTRFSETIAIASLVSLVLLSVLHLGLKKK